MDNDTPDPLASRRPQCRFGPDRRLTLAIACLAAVAIVVGALTSDPEGRLLFVGAAIVLAGYALVDVVFWPRLSADADGVIVRTPFARTALAWPEIDSVTADVRDRLGLRSTTLEIDAGEHLIVFSRRALGADPARVADMIRAFDPR